MRLDERNTTFYLEQIICNYIILLPALDMANPARHNSNLNNPWIPKFQEEIRREQENGMYSATLRSEYGLWSALEAMSERGVKQAIAAARAVCNQSEFEGVRFTHQIEEDEYGGKVEELF